MVLFFLFALFDLAAVGGWMILYSAFTSGRIWGLSSVYFVITRQSGGGGDGRFGTTAAVSPCWVLCGEDGVKRGGEVYANFTLRARTFSQQRG